MAKRISRVSEKQLFPEDKLRINELSQKQDGEKLFPFERDESEIFQRPQNIAKTLNQQLDPTLQKVVSQIQAKVGRIKTLIKILEGEDKSGLEHFMIQSKSAWIFQIIEQEGFIVYLKEFLSSLTQEIKTILSHKREHGDIDDTILRCTETRSQELLVFLCDVYNQTDFIQNLPPQKLQQIKNIDHAIMKMHTIIDLKQSEKTQTILQKNIIESEGFVEFYKRFIHRLNVAKRQIGSQDIIYVTLPQDIQGFVSSLTKLDTLIELYDSDLYDRYRTVLEQSKRIDSVISRVSSLVTGLPNVNLRHDSIRRISYANKPIFRKFAEEKLTELQTIRKLLLDTIDPTMVLADDMYELIYSHADKKNILMSLYDVSKSKT